MLTESIDIFTAALSDKFTNDWLQEDFIDFKTYMKTKNNLHVM